MKQKFELKMFLSKEFYEEQTILRKISFEHTNLTILQDIVFHVKI